MSTDLEDLCDQAHWLVRVHVVTQPKPVQLPILGGLRVTIPNRDVHQLEAGVILPLVQVRQSRCDPATAGPTTDFYLTLCDHTRKGCPQVSLPA